MALDVRDHRIHDAINGHRFAVAQLEALVVSRVREKLCPKSIGLSSDSSHRSGPMHSSIASTLLLIISSAISSSTKFLSTSLRPCVSIRSNNEESWTKAALMIPPQAEITSALSRVGKNAASTNV